LVACPTDDPMHLPGHLPWDRKFGIKDFGFGSNEGVAETQARLDTALADEESGLRYNKKLHVELGEMELVSKQRKRATYWAIRAPTKHPEYTPGEIPLFYHNGIMPRLSRFMADPSLAIHPCGVYGITHLALMVPAKRAQCLIKSYGRILGVPSLSSAKNRAVFELKRYYSTDAIDPLRLVIYTVEHCDTPSCEITLGGTGHKPRFFKLDLETENESSIYIDVDRHRRSTLPPKL
jgi:hypothetical protein